jgi:hypothetical protein
MDWLTFILKIVEALSWPLVVLTIAYWLRPHLHALVACFEAMSGRVKKVSVGNVEAEFTAFSPRPAPPVLEVKDQGRAVD